MPYKFNPFTKKLDYYEVAGSDATKEDVANKTTDGTLSANSDTLYPSEKAVKTYVDGLVAGAGVSDAERLYLFGDNFDAWNQINASANWVALRTRNMLRPGLVIDTAVSTGFQKVDGTNASAPVNYFQPRALLALYLQMEGVTDNSSYVANGTGASNGTFTNTAITFDSVNFKVGTQSAVFNGTTSQISLGSTYQRYTNLTNEDFTLSTWVRFSGAPGTFCIMSRGQNSGAQKSWVASILSDRIRFSYTTNSGSTMIDADSTTTSWSTSTWYHIEITRVGNTLYFFKDGVALGTADVTGVSISTSSSSQCRIGNDGVGAASQNFFNGNMDDFRFYLGHGIHTSGFTPDTTTLTDFDIQNMVAQFPSSPAPVVPTRAYVMWSYRDSTQTPTLNTDLKVWASRDNGTTWTQITNIATLGINGYSGGYVDISGQPSGSTVKIKFETFNNKRYRIGPTMFAWS